MVALIRKLTIERFRGLEKLEWKPAPGLNVLLGGGDVGKSTVLDAIALLLSPSNNPTIGETDYWMRDTDDDFCIEAVMTLPLNSEISAQRKFIWPWHWDGQDAVVPVLSENGGEISEADVPVYRLRVRGTPELDLNWEIVQPDEQIDLLSLTVRRQIGLVQLDANDRNDRDLRLVYGSALDRFLSDPALRARIGKAVGELDFRDALGSTILESLEELNSRLEKASLPSDISLGLTTTRGLSLGALIGLFAHTNDTVALPLTKWGAGTRRMAALELSAATEKNTSITTIDEVERGLEPYKLRQFMRSLLDKPGQSFVTTHSPVAIASAPGANLWYLDSSGNIGALPRKKIEAQQKRDPETFLSKVPVIAEGATEVGLLTFVLEKAFGGPPLDYGVRVCNGQGNDETLNLLEALSRSGLKFAGLADDEKRSPDRWQNLKKNLGNRLLQWEHGCTEEIVIEAIPDEHVRELLRDEDGDFDGDRLRTLADRLELKEKDLKDIEETLCRNGKTLRGLIIQAATGDAEGAPNTMARKAWKKHGQRWFKSEEGGRELAKKMVSLGAWPALQDQFLPLVNEILSAAGQPKKSHLAL